jgi:hypothetical protein
MIPSVRTRFVRRALIVFTALGLASAAGGLLGAAAAQGGDLPSEPEEDCPTCPVTPKFRCNWNNTRCVFDDNGKTTCSVSCDSVCVCR